MIKLSVFSNDTILYLSKLTEKLQQIIKESSKLKGIKLIYSNE